MSNLQNDQDVINDGRRNTIKEAELPLRDQIVNRLYEKLEEDKIGSKLVDGWLQSLANRSEALARQQSFLQDIDDFVPDDSSGENDWGGVSNIHIPQTFIVGKTYHARFVDAILGQDPPFSLKARREDGVASIAAQEGLMRYTLSTWANHNQGVEAVVDQFIWDWALGGTAIFKTRWETQYETYVDVIREKTPTTPLVQIADDGTEYLVPQATFKDKEERVTRKVFDGPILEQVDLEDFDMIGGDGDPDTAHRVYHRQWWTASDLWTAVDQKKFKEEAVERLIKSGGQHIASAIGNDIKQQRAMDAGVDAYQFENRLDEYEVLEVCVKYDVDGSGINSDLVVWVSKINNDILGCTYLRRINPSGCRPYAVARFHNRKGTWMGVGLAEILLPMAKELDAMHNIRIDNAIYQSIPFFFYRASSGMDPAKFQVKPGQGIPLDNPQTDVYFPNVGNRTSFTAQEEQVIQSYVERLTGISDLSLGVQSGTQGATRTASGVRALLGENNNNLSIHLRRLNRAWSRTLRNIQQLLKNRVDPGFAFRVTGEDGSSIYMKVTDQDLAYDVDFELSANTANSNKAVQLETSQIVMGMTMNPINIQMGLSGPDEMYQSQKAYLANLGIKDIHKYLKRPKGLQENLTPEAEFNRVIRGQQVPVNINADHEAFIAFAQSILDAQDKDVDTRTLNPEQEQLLIQQMRQHESAAAALQQQQAQQDVIMQMQNNAQNASAQAPVAQNPMSGAGIGELFTTNV